MPSATYDEPKTSVEVVGAHALKMGWMEKAEEESFMKGWHKRFVVLTGCVCLIAGGVLLQ
jgi:hypothetical protein